MACLFILSNVFWKAKAFNFDEVQVIDLFTDWALMSYLVIRLNQGHKDFLMYFSLDILNFYFLVELPLLLYQKLVFLYFLYFP